MAKLIVIPKPSDLTGMSSMAMAGGFAAAADLPSQRQTLEIRREALMTFARTMAAESSRVRGTFAAAGVADAMSADAVRALPAVGALIVDEQLVDRFTAEGVHGALVFDNLQIPLVQSDGKAAESSAEPDFWHLEKIDIGFARDRGLTGDGTLVGVLDTGIDAGHTEFANKTVHFQEFDLDGHVVFNTARDAGDHGTHVSGLIAGHRSGVAPGADLAVAAVLTYTDEFGRKVGYLAQILEGLNWLLSEAFRGDDAALGVDLVNASLGGSGYNNYLYSSLLTSRISNGTVMAAAIGNSGRFGIDNWGTPGGYDIAIAVGATDRNDRVADFSDWGTIPQHSGLAKPDLCAPGVDVWSAKPHGGFQEMSGTSMACPIVAGACALLLQADRPRYDWDADALTDDIVDLTVPITPTARSGRGRLSLRSI
ncbi:MAG: S8 family serine peptidase [Thermoanaerobaculia bacterium]|nr:S8 family serine peptidase [Thermoanaerobaculia bacterium]